MTREYTNKLLEMVENCELESESVLLACLNYMSESDVQDMMECNEFISDDEY